MKRTKMIMALPILAAVCAVGVISANVRMIPKVTVTVDTAASMPEASEFSGEVTRTTAYEEPEIIETETETEPYSEENIEYEADEIPVEPPTDFCALPDLIECNGSGRLEVEAVLQNPELPTGCEVTALDTVLRYHGFDIDKLALFDGYMPQAGVGESDFDRAFIGDPRYRSGYGCFAPVVAETARNFFADCDNGWTAYDLSGSELSELFPYIDMGYPVIVWASMGLVDITWRYAWTTPDGVEAYFPACEHCMVLTGYDAASDTVYAADPLKGNMNYSLSGFQYIYDKMKQQAVLVCPI